MFPTLFKIGDFAIPTYGVLVALGFLAGLKLASVLARRSGLDQDKIANLGVFGALAGLLGAKVLMLLFDLPHYVEHPEDIFSIATLQAGGVFYGGLIVAIGVTAWMIRRDNLPLGPTLDVFAPGLALGQAIGRLGCFAAGCCWGTHCDRPWAVTFHNLDAFRTTGVPLHQPLHPAQLYEAGLLLLVFLATLAVFRRTHAPGAIFALYLVLTGLARFGAEFFRAHQQPNLFSLPISNAQWISLALVALGIAIHSAGRRGAVAAESRAAASR